MTPPSHLKSLQALELALRTGSLKEAAERLAITPAAVGQRIKALEDYLCVDLLIRGRSGLMPSQEVAAALPHLQLAFTELEAASGHLNLQRGQEIHITADADFAEFWLAPRLAQFRSEFPNLLFSVNGEGDAQSRGGTADVDITLLSEQEDDENNLSLFNDVAMPFCSSSSLKRLKKESREEKLEGFPLLHLDYDFDGAGNISWKTWLEQRGFNHNAPERGIRFKRLSAALAAVHSDAGVLLCGAALILDELDSGKLALPFGSKTRIRFEKAYQARFRPLSLRKGPLSSFRNWLEKEASETADRLSDIADSR